MMYALKCLEPMHALLEQTPLHVQKPMHNVVMLMEVEKDLKLFPNISEKLEHKFKSFAPLTKSPNHLLCNNRSGHESFSGLSHHPMKEKTNTKKRRVKMHVKL